MKPTGAPAVLALLFLFATIANAHHDDCGYDSGSYQPSAISSGAEIVTYGEPCFCKESLPYAIQVPKTVPTRVEKLGSYGYSVVTPSESHASCLQMPVKIQTPIVEGERHDYLRGQSYGVTVQHQAYRPGPRRHSFDFAVQEPQKVHRVHKPSLDFSIYRVEEQIDPRFAPLPIAVQTPIEKPAIYVPRLTGLKTSVDRVLLPACDVDNCPDCNDIRVSEPVYSPCE